MSEQWKVELFSCSDDINTCLLGWCCSCYLFGQNTAATSGANQWLMCLGYCCLTGCYACGALHYSQRQKFRAKYNLIEEPNDLLAAIVLSGCANCQEAREMEARGMPSSDARARTYQPR